MIFFWGHILTDGSLVDVLTSRSTPLPPEIVCRVFWHTCQAVQHMHSQSPPIIHRDLKVISRSFSYLISNLQRDVQKYL